MEEIYEAFDCAEQIAVYSDGVKTQYSAGDENYIKILSCWNKMVEGSHPMPAFGVSINEFTLKEMQMNLWVEFVFSEQYKCYGLPFEKLLVTVNKSFYGFNLIRYTERDGYYGRCFYIDLAGKNMSELYDLLLSL